jgi:hypothetical protein
MSHNFTKPRNDLFDSANRRKSINFGLDHFPEQFDWIVFRRIGGKAENNFGDERLEITEEQSFMVAEKMFCPELHGFKEICTDNHHTRGGGKWGRRDTEDNCCG